MVLLTQSLGDFPPELLRTVFGSVGCKAVFAGVNPDDAQYFADSFGKYWVEELTTGSNLGRSETSSRTEESTTWGPSGPSITRHGQSDMHGISRSLSASARQVERYVWAPHEIINDVPPGHALVSLALPNGQRVPVTIVNLRA
jgi:hypothetical protein